MRLCTPSLPMFAVVGWKKRRRRGLESGGANVLLTGAWSLVVVESRVRRSGDARMVM